MGEREKTRNIEDNKSKNQELLELMALCLSDMEWKREVILKRQEENSEQRPIPEGKILQEGKGEKERTRNMAENKRKKREKLNPDVSHLSFITQTEVKKYGWKRE